MASHTIIISHAIVVHGVDDDTTPEHTGAVVREIMRTVIRDRTSLDCIQSVVLETRVSTDHEVYTTNQNDIDDPPHLPAYVNEDGTILVTLVNNEQEALVATRGHTTERWRAPHHTYLTRP